MNKFKTKKHNYIYKYNKVKKLHGKFICTKREVLRKLNTYATWHNIY